MFLLFLLITFGVRFGQTDDLPSIPALGRPFRLGDMYNAETNQLILGRNFWTSTQLANSVQENTNRRTELTLGDGDDVQEKLNHFNIKIELECTFLSGKIQVNGGAEYLQDAKRKSNSWRVDYNYKVDTKFLSMKPEYLDGARHPNNFDGTERIEKIKGEERATHVVVGIEYGARAIFVFEKDEEESTDGATIKGHLEIKIELASIKIRGSAKFSSVNNETSKDNTLKVKFHGDFIIDEPPTDIESARKLYGSLRKELGDPEKMENVVPQHVYLYPMKYMEASPLMALLKDAIKPVIKKAAKIMHEFTKFVQDANMVNEALVVAYHPRLRMQTATFVDCIERYKAYYGVRLAEILPQLIRQKAIEQSGPLRELFKLMVEKEQSPYGYTAMMKWTQERIEETALLTAGLYVPNRAPNSGEFSGYLSRRNVTYTLALSLYVAKKDDKYIQEGLLDYWKKRDKENKDGKPIEKSLDYKGAEPVERWWDAHQKPQQVLAYSSKDMYRWYLLEEEKKKKGLDSIIQFGIREAYLNDSESAEPHVNLELYADGQMINSDYTIPSMPGRAMFHNSSHDYIVIKWHKPYRGRTELKYYEIMILQDEKHWKLTNDYWKPKVTETKDMPHEQGLYGVKKRYYLPPKEDNVTKEFLSSRITDLPADTEMFFQISCFSAYGQTAKAEISFMMKTTKCSPGFYHTERLKCVHCAAGTYSNAYGTGHPKGSSCPQCPSGTFQPLPGQTSCRPCAEPAIGPGSMVCKCPEAQTLPKVCSTIECIIKKLGKYFSKSCKEERRSYVAEKVV